MKQISGIAAILTVLAANPGCQEYTDRMEPPLEARIRVDPMSLQFGALQVGSQLTLEAAITNGGEANLHLEELSIEGPSSFDLDAATTLRLLEPGDSTHVSVTYTPWTDEAAVGELHLRSNDPNMPDLAVELLAWGIAPVIQLDPEVWDFGDQEVGCEQEQAITIRNIGSSPLILSELVFTPTSDEMVENHFFQNGIQLDPGASSTISIYYEPRDELSDIGYLHVYSNDPATPDAQAIQYGAAHLAGEKVDVFTQTWTDQMDILWVVDNSPGMPWNVASLGANLAMFFDILEVMDVDYHVATITMDDAAFVGGLVLTPGSSAAEKDAYNTAMATAFDPANPGSPIEQGFQMGSDALTPPLAAPGGANDGFLRDIAGLRVIFMSNAEEHSAQTVSTFVNLFQSLKPNPNHVILSGITGQLAGCSDGDLLADPAPRYEQAIQLTGGVSASICDSNWVNVLSNICWSTWTGGDTFELSEQAAEVSIAVALNGVPVYVGWYYDAVLNAVVFEPDYRPDTGDVITVTYNILGACEP